MPRFKTATPPLASSLCLAAWFVCGLMFAAPALAAGHSDRLDDIDRVLAARGYRAQLASKDHVAVKFLGDGSAVSVTLWMKSPAGQGLRLRDARQIKFTQSYCNSDNFEQTRFAASAKLERDAFFRDVIGQAPPPELDADMSTLDYLTKKNYSMPPFQRARLAHFAMKCDVRGGDAYEFDLFP